MSIYTKKGDKGTTAIFGGACISKADQQIEMYGSLDELSSYIGLILTKIKDSKDRRLLTDTQKSLYRMIGFLCGSGVELGAVESEIGKLEKHIDKTETKLPKLTCFILPQGNETSCLFHVARTVCRRTERAAVRFFKKRIKKGKNKDYNIILKYLNRLSDLLFVMARKYNTQREISA